MTESTRKHKDEAPKKLGYAIFTCSTSRHQQLQKGESMTDVSGDLMESLLKNSEQAIILRKIISDDKDMIIESIKNVLKSDKIDVAIFCGGTGIAPRDITIETVTPFLEKTLLGFGEIFRQLSWKQISSAAIMSRAVAGVAKGKAFFCIPGSPDAVKLCVENLILPEAGHIVKHARE